MTHIKDLTQSCFGWNYTHSAIHIHQPYTSSHIDGMTCFNTGDLVSRGAALERVVDISPTDRLIYVMSCCPY